MTGIGQRAHAARKLRYPAQGEIADGAKGRAGRTRIRINGELKQERDVMGQPLSVVSPWEWTPNPDSPALLIGSWHSATQFECLELRPL